LGHGEDYNTSISSKDLKDEEKVEGNLLVPTPIYLGGKQHKVTKAWIPKGGNSIPMLGESKMEGRIMLRV
jgi:hypothetical protein